MVYPTKTAHGEIVFPLTGKTPNGRGFTITLNSLEWHASGEIGSITIPLRLDADHQALCNEIIANGFVCGTSRDNNFAT